MRLDAEREAGRIGDDTEVVNTDEGNEYIAYAEARFGPFDIQFTRERRSEMLGRRDAQLVYRGPYVGAEGTYSEKTTVPVNETTMERLDDHLDTWDYVELCDSEVFEA